MNLIESGPNKSNSDTFVPGLGFDSYVEKKSDYSEIRAKLLAHNLSPTIVDKVIKRYENETDINKLIFFANGLEFSSDIF